MTLYRLDFCFLFRGLGTNHRTDIVRDNNETYLKPTRKMSQTPENPSDSAIDTLQPYQVLESLNRLDVSLKDLSSQRECSISFYRSMPQVLIEAKDILLQGAELVHATSTKYTLVGKIDTKEQTKIAQDLLRGCQLVGTATLLWHEPGTGASARRHVLQAARAIVRTVQQLVQSFVDGTALEENNNIGAQRTGAVWSACNAVIERKVALGNRNAIRRDLLTYSIECNDTIEEFETMLEAEPSSPEDNQDDGWDAFMEGETDQYSASEKTVASAGVSLIKCSRGSLNAALQACESVGSEETPENCQFIATTVELARPVGEGVTDLGASLYPPLDLEEVEEQVNDQHGAMAALLEFVKEGAISNETMELIGKLQPALTKRHTEALDAIEAAKQVQT